MEAVARKNYKRSTPGRAVILGCAKNVVISESREITRVVYLGQITIIGSSGARKLLQECSREGQHISMRNKLLEKGGRLGIA